MHIFSVSSRCQINNKQEYVTVRLRMEQTERDQPTKDPNSGIGKELHNLNDQTGRKGVPCQTNDTTARYNQVCQNTSASILAESRGRRFWPSGWTSFAYSCPPKSNSFERSLQTLLGFAFYSPLWLQLTTLHEVTGPSQLSPLPPPGWKK